MEEEIKWNDRKIEISHSPNALRYNDPEIFYHPVWSSIYVITMAFGKYDSREPPGVYKIRASALKINPISNQ